MRYINVRYLLTYLLTYLFSSWFVSLIPPLTDLSIHVHTIRQMSAWSSSGSLTMTKAVYRGGHSAAETLL